MHIKELIMPEELNTKEIPSRPSTPTNSGVLSSSAPLTPFSEFSADDDENVACPTWMTELNELYKQTSAMVDNQGRYDDNARFLDCLKSGIFGPEDEIDYDWTCDSVYNTPIQPTTASQLPPSSRTKPIAVVIGLQSQGKRSPPSSCDSYEASRSLDKVKRRLFDEPKKKRIGIVRRPIKHQPLTQMRASQFIFWAKRQRAIGQNDPVQNYKYKLFEKKNSILQRKIKKQGEDCQKYRRRCKLLADVVRKEYESNMNNVLKHVVTNPILQPNVVKYRFVDIPKCSVETQPPPTMKDCSCMCFCKETSNVDLGEPFEPSNSTIKFLNAALKPLPRSRRTKPSTIISMSASSLEQPSSSSTPQQSSTSSTSSQSLRPTSSSSLEQPSSSSTPQQSSTSSTSSQSLRPTSSSSLEQSSSWTSPTPQQSLTSQTVPMANSEILISSSLRSDFLQQKTDAAISSALNKPRQSQSNCRSTGWISKGQRPGIDSQASVVQTQCSMSSFSFSSSQNSQIGPVNTKTVTTTGILQSQKPDFIKKAPLKVSSGWVSCRPVVMNSSTGSAFNLRCPSLSQPTQSSDSYSYTSQTSSPSQNQNTLTEPPAFKVPLQRKTKQTLLPFTVKKKFYSQDSGYTYDKRN